MHQFKTPRIPPFHSMSVANAWASGHALSMVMLSNPQIAVDCYLNTFTLLFKPMKTTFDGGPPLMEDGLWWKMTFDGRWPSICKMTFMDDDLWWRVPSKWWSCSIFLRSSSFLRLSQCLTSHSSLEDDPLWKTTFDGRPPLMVHLTFGSVCRLRLLRNKAFGLS